MSDPQRPLHPLERRPEVEPEYTPPRRPQRGDFRRMLGRTPLVWTLIAINVSIFVLGLFTPNLETWLVINGANQGVAVLEGGQYWRLFTSMFLHGSILHVAFNMLALFNLGQGLEQTFGRRRFLAVYLLSGLGGSIMSAVLNTPNTFSVGASGAVFGLMGAYLVFLYENRGLMGGAARAGIQSVVFYLVLNLMIGIAPGSNIDNWAHIGGFLAGAALTYLIGPLLSIQREQNTIYERVRVRITDSRPTAIQAQNALLFGALLLGVLIAARVGLI